MNKRLNRTQRNYIIMGLCAVLLIMAVGYAAFQSQLKITGTSNIGSNFLVRITGIQSNVQSGSASNAIEPSYTDTTATFKTNLVSPGDSMKYDITVANEGNIDAVLNSIKVNNSNNEAITFETSGIEEGDELKASESDILTVIVTYNPSITSQPENTTATITVTLDYGQSNGTVTPPIPSGITSDDLKALAVTEGDGLYADEYESGRFIYKGANPNNYITFNNETWRILSVENDGRIKIVRNESIGSRDFDSGGSNVWETSDIKIYLNGEYLESITVNKEKIVPSTWSIGGVTYDNNNLAGQITKENGTQSQTVSVGLITVSEYLRANTNAEQCGNMSIYNTNRTTCLTTNWIYDIVPSGGYLRTISPRASNTSDVFYVSGSSSYAGNVYYSTASSSNGVSPVFYLSSDITLIGDGGEGSPYQIG